MALETVLAEKRNAVAEAWLVATLRSYPDQASDFLLREKDPFRNPVGHTLKEGLPRLLDAVLGGADVRAVEPTLDGIVRLRSVQDVSASRAVAFLQDLKRVVREQVGDHVRDERDRDALRAIEDRIDAMTLVAVDLLVRCREQLAEIRLNEARRRLFVLERTFPGLAGADDSGRRS